MKKTLLNTGYVLAVILCTLMFQRIGLNKAASACINAARWLASPQSDCTEPPNRDGVLDTMAGLLTRQREINLDAHDAERTRLQRELDEAHAKRFLEGKLDETDDGKSESTSHPVRTTLDSDTGAVEPPPAGNAEWREEQLPANNREETAPVAVQVEIVEPVQTVVTLPDFFYTGTIHEAVRESDFRAVKWLVERDATLVFARTTRGHTALHFAARYNPKPDIAIFLLDHGAEISARDQDGDTPLIEAAWKNPDPAMLELLMTHGADPFAKDRYGHTALHCSAWANPSAAVSEHLLDLGLSLDTQDHNGRNVLKWSRLNPNPKVRQFLLEQASLLAKQRCLLKTVRNVRNQ